jgi:hypothetical protein
MSRNFQPKERMAVAEMARMTGLSRARFYQLIGTAFPHPIYDIATRRPFYAADQQIACLEVRQTNRGVDGRPILFYCRKVGASRQRMKTQRNRKDKALVDLVDGLKGLGLSSATEADVRTAVKELFPAGRLGNDAAEVLRTVFVHLKLHRRGDGTG